MDHNNNRYCSYPSKIGVLNGTRSTPALIYNETDGIRWYSLKGLVNLLSFNQMITDKQYTLATSSSFEKQYCKKAAQLINAKSPCLGKCVGQRGGDSSILPYPDALIAYNQILKESETLPKPKLSSYQKLKNTVQGLLQKNTKLEREAGQLELEVHRLQVENDKLHDQNDKLQATIIRLTRLELN